MASSLLGVRSVLLGFVGLRGFDQIACHSIISSVYITCRSALGGLGRWSYVFVQTSSCRGRRGWSLVVLVRSGHFGSKVVIGGGGRWWSVCGSGRLRSHVAVQRSGRVVIRRSCIVVHFSRRHVLFGVRGSCSQSVIMSSLLIYDGDINRLRTLAEEGGSGNSGGDRTDVVISKTSFTDAML